MNEVAPSAPVPDGEPERAPPPPERPDRIGRYRVERILGEGSFGVVYLAHDDNLQRLVAIKVPTADLLAKTGAPEAFLEEGRKVAKLCHKHIVEVFDCDRTDGGTCYIVYKYVEGGSLADLLKRGARPAPKKAAALIADVADALHHAHLQELVHRDVKPANILLDADGRALLTDFGMALRNEHFGTRVRRRAGTPKYMSPEQARWQSDMVDGRADVYSLGAVLYELLTGQVPFPSVRRDELLEQIASPNLEVRPPRQLATDLPAELEEICLKALAKEVTKRYPTAHDFATDLRKWLRPSRRRASTPSPPIPEFAGDRQKRMGLAAVGIALFCLVVLLLISWKLFLAHNRPTIERLLRDGKYGKAIEEVEQLHRDEKDDEAIRWLDKIIQADPDGCGNNCFATRAEYCSQRNNTKPREALACYMNARTSHTEGRYKEAMKDYESAVKLDPALFLASNNLAFLLATRPEVKDKSDAINYATQACKGSGNRSWRTLNTLAVAYAANNNWDEAIKTAEQSLQLCKAFEERRNQSEECRKQVEYNLENFKKNQQYMPEPSLGDRCQ
jgi:serine/threonine protein kinase